MLIRVGISQSNNLNVGIALAIGCLMIGQHKQTPCISHFLCMCALFWGGGASFFKRRENREFGRVGMGGSERIL